jgi:hypothetical protein
MNSAIAVPTIPITGVCGAVLHWTTPMSKRRHKYQWAALQLEKSRGKPMAIFKKKPETPPGQGSKDPRDPVGNNPTGRARKSSAGRRGKAERKLDKDLKGTEFDKKKDEDKK